MKRDKILYWVFTGLLCAMYLMSATMYLLNYDEIAGVYEILGYPTYIVYPFAVVKILAVVAILSNLSPLLKYLAYAGIFYNTILAASAHIMVGDGEAGGAIAAFTLCILSFIFDRRRAKAAVPVQEAATV
ncbi:DoxX family protein [Pontibacter sp. G13]|uniref:DoxX family protein n=1 Tax=Pontibacter sp. G13 TaxID=3074898 RepID=UPI00288BC17B|nr:DoxX family protein [Pontibacter sp. G13]WNJ18943.1 DoxX family protein [Pontibacter sp. G13]